MIYDFYITRHWLRAWITTLVGVSLILLISTQLLQWMAFRSEHDLSWGLTGLLLLYHVPGIILYAVPMASLVASGLVMSQLNRESALRAMQASRVSNRRLLQPFFILGLILSLASLGFSERIVIPSNETISRLKNEITNREAPAGIRYKQFDSTGQPRMILSAASLVDNTLTNPRIIIYTSGRVTRIIQADQAVYLAPEWYSDRYSQYDVAADAAMRVSVHETGPLPIDLDLDLNPKQLNKRPQKADTLTLQALRRQIAYKGESGIFSRDDQFSFHAKLAMPFTTLIFTLLGAILLFNRNKPSLAIIGGVGVVILYYTLVSIAMGLSLIGWVNPVVAAWLPTLLLFGILAIN